MTYSNRLVSSDLDAYRSDGVIQTRSITFSGSVGAGATKTVTATAFNLTDMDFHQILFDNSVHSPSKYRDINLEWGTFITESTFGSELVAYFSPYISGSTLTISATLFNPYASSITLTSTTINFRFIAYDSTLL